MRTLSLPLVAIAAFLCLPLSGITSSKISDSLKAEAQRYYIIKEALDPSKVEEEFKGGPLGEYWRDALIGVYDSIGEEVLELLEEHQEAHIYFKDLITLGKESLKADVEGFRKLTEKGKRRELNERYRALNGIVSLVFACCTIEDDKELRKLFGNNSEETERAS